MEKDSRESFSGLCAYLFTRNGSPVCIFRIAEDQPCGFLRERACYYRGGPFGPLGSQSFKTAKKTE